MKKRKLGIACLITVAVSMTACGSSIPEMTEDQNAQIVEYAAGLLLKYDANYDGRLVDMEESAPEENTSVETPAPAEGETLPQETEAADSTDMSGTAETDAADTEGGTAAETAASEKRSMEEFYGIEGITIKYTGYELRDVYSGDDGQEETQDLALAMTATKGCKLLVLNFEVTNSGTADENIDMLTAGAKFKISINGGESKYALSTMLPNDLSSYVGTAAPGALMNLVLVREIPEDEAGTIETISLSMRNTSEEATILLD